MNTPEVHLNHSSQPLALVTGASRGIGASIALRLAKDGFFVLLNYASNRDQAQAVLDQILSLPQGGGALCPFDVSHSSAVDQAFQEIQTQYGSLSVLVNNAGITADALLVRMKDEDLERILAVNLKGAMYCTRSAAKSMMRTRQGSIIQITSVAGEMGNPGQAAYTAAKAGLIGFTKTTARELGSRHVRVNAVSPGFITTEMTEVLTDAQKEAILRGVPLGFFGAPEDVASMVAFLASPHSRYITGQVFGVNGGMYM